MGCVWAGFGRCLGLQVGAKLALKLRFWRLLGALGRLLGASWFPRAANMVARASQGGSKSGYLVDFRWILMQILHRFIHKFPGMSVTGPRRKTQYVLPEGRGARHIMSGTRAAASWEGGLANLVVACTRSMGLPFSLHSKPHVQGRPAVCA